MRMRDSITIAVGSLLMLAVLGGCSMWNQPAQVEPPVARSMTTSSAKKPAVPDELPPKESARLCLATAEEMQKKGHADQAIFLYEKAREGDPTLPKVAHHLALLYDAQGNGARALEEYRKALAATPKDPDLLNDFGYYNYRRGNLPEAERWYRQALTAAPHHEAATTNLAVVLGHQHRYDESIKLFTKVVGPAAAQSNVGVLAVEQGDYDVARKAFLEAQRLDGTLKQPKAFLAYLDNRQSTLRAALPASY